MRASATIRRLEYTHQVGPDADHAILAIKAHGQAGEAATDDVSLFVQPGWQRSVIFAYSNLFDPALGRDRGAVGIAPRVVSGSCWPSGHGALLESRSSWCHGREPGFIGVPVGLPAVTWCPGGVVGRARHRDTLLVALRDKLK
ncbi:MAG: hypothetical protein JO287_00505 [Pseudonocardiales bacterium]|nr:hypothetical protein [Pseudonocardiales bacterium]